MTSDERVRIDSATLTALYREHAEEIQAFLLGILRDADLAAEVLQAAFAKAVEAGHTSREDTRKGWLFKVAFNEAMRVKRRRKLQERSIRRMAWNQTTERDESPELNLVREETVERVKQALHTLPAPQRTVVHMRIYEEKTFAVIAEELALPLGTVLTRMRLALQKLQKILKAGDEPDGVSGGK